MTGSTTLPHLAGSTALPLATATRNAVSACETVEVMPACAAELRAKPASEPIEALRALDAGTALRLVARTASIAASAIHLDAIRDWKQVASLAYPMPEEQGLLRGSRLRA